MGMATQTPLLKHRHYLWSGKWTEVTKSSNKTGPIPSVNVTGKKIVLAGEQGDVLTRKGERIGSNKVAYKYLKIEYIVV